MIAVVGDIHIGKNSTSEEFVKYQSDSFKKMVDICEEKNISDIVFLGDIFDTRNAISVPVIKKVKGLFKYAAKKLNIHLIIGNHDTFYKNTNEINSPTIIFDECIFDGVNYNKINIYNEPTEVTFDGKLCSMIPWINKTNEEKILEYIKNSSSSYCFGHFDIIGFLMNSKVKCDRGYSSDIFSHFDLVWSGHYHTRSSQKNIIYAGSATQLSWHDYGQKRGFYLFSPESNEHEFISLGEELFTKIHINDKVKIKDFESVNDKILKVYINRKISTKEYKELYDIIEKNIKCEIIDNTIIDLDVDFDVENETIQEILKGSVDGQENVSDGMKKDAYNLLIDAMNKVLKNEI